MSATRFRRIARLEKLAEPYLEWKSQIEKEWEETLAGAARHAAVIAFVIHYGNPQIDEPLKCASQRCAEAAAWKVCCDAFPGTLHTGHGFTAHDRDSVSIIGDPLRYLVISSFPGSDEKQKLDRVFAAAPPWLLWFTFADYTAALLGLTLPDLSEVSQFMRSRENFDLWWGLPRDAFEQKPWPHGKEVEPLARTNLDLLRPAMELPVRTMTNRDLKREREASMTSEGSPVEMSWPPLIPGALLKLSFDEKLKLIRRHSDDYHHPLTRSPMPASTKRRF
jgi:hypothetical protein